MGMFTEGRIKSLKVNEQNGKIEVVLTIDPVAPFAFEYNGTRHVLFVEGDENGHIKNEGRIVAYDVLKYSVAKPFLDALLCAKVNRAKCRFWKLEESTQVVVEFV